MEEKELTMLDYILETPSVVLKNIDNSKELTKPMVDLYCNNNYQGFCIIACGSSYNSSFAAKSFMCHYLKERIDLVFPFTYTNHENDLHDNMLHVCVSQTGCSTNTIDALKLVKSKGFKAVGLVGKNDCDMKEVADVLVNYGVGIEVVGYETKGVIVLATFWMLTALEIALRKGTITKSEYDKAKDDMRLAMNLHQEIVKEAENKFNMNKKLFTTHTNSVVLSSGPNLPSAIEGSLKISETSNSIAYPSEVEEFLHGYNMTIDPSYRLILIDNNDSPSSKRIVEAYHAMNIITDNIFIISNDESIPEDHAFRTTKETNPLVSPLYKIPCMQMIAYLISSNTNNFNHHVLYKEFSASGIISTKTRKDLYIESANNNI